jgi:hypothetical protein
MKKSVLLFIAYLIGIATLYAQAPDAFKYQAVARDASGEVIANQLVDITITILQGSISGTSVYTETHDSTTNEFGLVNLTIGAGDPTGFAAIDWNNGPYFVKVEMDGSLMGISQLLSVPYAKYADNAGNIFSGNYSDLTGTPNNVSTFTNDAGYLTGYTETDPVFGAHAASEITSTNITNWTTAYGWNDHSTIGYTTTDTTLNETEVDNFVANNGYLTSETDPIFVAHAANGITSTNITNWTTAYGWNDHSLAGYTTTDTTLNETEVDNFVANNGYLTSETDPVYGSSVASGITQADTTNWNNKLDSYTETDPVFGAHAANGITSTNIANWTTAYGWSDHSTIGYFTAGGEAGGTNRTLGNTDDFSLGFKTNDATRLFITNDGKVGIGTTTPTGYLEVTDKGDMNPQNLLLVGQTITLNRLRLSSGTNYATISVGDSYDENKGIIIPHSTGNVGIGTNNPSTELDVNGNVHVAGDLTVDGAIEVAENIEIQSDVSLNLSASGIQTYSTVDANAIGFGAALYLATDGNYEEADANAASTMPCVALALETGTGTKDILLQGYIRYNNWTWSIIGGPVYVSPTKGVLTQTIPTATGQQVQIVGYATKSNTIYFSPNLMLIELK